MAIKLLQIPFLGEMLPRGLLEEEDAIGEVKVDAPVPSVINENDSGEITLEDPAAWESAM